MIANLDFETRSAADLSKVGSYRYAEDDSTSVLIVGISLDRGPVETWDIRQPVEGSKALGMLRTAIEEGYEIHAWNAPFEWGILKSVCPGQLGLPIPKIEQMRCTAAVCRAAGVPPSLAKAAEFLKMPQQKDKMGKPLIQKFSVPQKKGLGFLDPESEDLVTVGGEKMTVAEAFDVFVSYCAKDVIVEMEIAEKMKDFALEGDILESFLFDMRMNDRGAPVNRKALENAQTLITQQAEKLTTEFKAITGLGPGQTARVLEWLKAGGYPGDNLQAATVAQHRDYEGMSPTVRRALQLKSELAFQAVKKVAALLDWCCKDDRVRGAFLWYGAQKTGRWTSKGPQFQNMKKPPKRIRKFIEDAFQDVLNSIDLETFQAFYGNPYEVLACLARYFVRYDNSNIYDIDYAQVEARILPELIECKRVVDLFRSGIDIYQGVADKLGGTRDEGKIISLLCQFQGGWRAVKVAMPNLPDSECRKAVKIYREENPEMPKAWKAFQDAFVSALGTPGKWAEVTKHVRFGFTRKGAFPRMMMRLPSGRKIVYPYPEAHPITMWKKERTTSEAITAPDGGITYKETVTSEWIRSKGHLNLDTPHFHTHELTFYGHVKGVLYGRVNTYGGDLLQSATQGTGMDLLNHGCVVSEKRGFHPFFVVHDQVLSPAQGGLDRFIDALCTQPEWFPDFPLEADGNVAISYSKS